MISAPFGSTELRSPRLACGVMRITGVLQREKLDAAAIERAIGCLEAAYEAGYRLFDHADIYGDTTCELVQGLALQRHPEWRKDIVLATKGGIIFENHPPGTPRRYDLGTAHLRQAVDGSLQRLGVERIDLYQLHRPDWLANPDDIAETLVDLHHSGKVRYFGVSNFRPSLVQALHRHLPFPLISQQVQIHLLRLDSFFDGTLDQCLEHRLVPMAWGPLAGGRLGAALDDTSPLPENASDAEAVTRLRPVLLKIATDYGVSRLVILLAWLLRHPSSIMPILGSTRAEVLRDATRAVTLELDRLNWYRILEAARGHKVE